MISKEEQLIRNSLKANFAIINTALKSIQLLTNELEQYKNNYIEPIIEETKQAIVEEIKTITLERKGTTITKGVPKQFCSGCKHNFSSTGEPIYYEKHSHEKYAKFWHQNCMNGRTK